MVHASPRSRFSRNENSTKLKTKGIEFKDYPNTRTGNSTKLKIKRIEHPDYPNIPLQVSAQIKNKDRLCIFSKTGQDNTMALTCTKSLIGGGCYGDNGSPLVIS